MARYTWRKRRRDSRRVSEAPSYSLHRGSDNYLAIVQQDKATGDWYWYGDGQNTAHMKTDLETAKREALAYITRNEQ